LGGSETMSRGSRWVAVTCAALAGGLAALPSATASSPGSSAPGAVAVVKAGDEITSLRNRTSRTFANGDGTLTARIWANSVNYQATDGTWLPIDTSLVATAKGWRNAANNFDLQLPRVLSSPVKISHGSDW